MSDISHQATWAPSATIDTLLVRAHVIKAIRSFFENEKLIEVTVPVMGARTVSDPYIDALGVNSPQHAQYRGVKGVLQTSPEYFLKRLLAAGMPDCYYLGAAFRADEPSIKHNPEFTMLEWYRIGWDEQTLCKQVFALIRDVYQALESYGGNTSHISDLSFELLSYRTLFERFTGVNPHLLSALDLEQMAKSKIDITFDSPSKAVWLDIIFSHLIEPHLEGCVGVYDFPGEQSALAKTALNDKGELVAKRFEVYLNGVELANGYHELTCASTFEKRYQDDCIARQKEDLPTIALDKKFLSAMQAGLPECAGVALGVDRLIMCLLNKPDITSVLPFSFEAL